ALLLPQLERAVPERVVADRGQEVHPSAETRRADSLVRTLAAVVGAEPAPDDRLPGLGNPVELDRQADPVAAQHCDTRHESHPTERTAAARRPRVRAPRRARRAPRASRATA